MRAPAEIDAFITARHATGTVPGNIAGHRFCDRLVTDRREAWTGTEAQIFGCRSSFAIARDLTELPVSKEEAARVFS